MARPKAAKPAKLSNVRKSSRLISARIEKDLLKQFDAEASRRGVERTVLLMEAMKLLLKKQRQFESADATDALVDLVRQLADGCNLEIARTGRIWQTDQYGFDALAKAIASLMSLLRPKTESDTQALLAKQYIVPDALAGDPQISDAYARARATTASPEALAAHLISTLWQNLEDAGPVDAEHMQSTSWRMQIFLSRFTEEQSRLTKWKAALKIGED